MTTKQTTNSEDSKKPKRKPDDGIESESCRTTNKHRPSPTKTEEERQYYFVIKLPYWLCGLGTLIAVLAGIVACFVTAITWIPKPDIRLWMQEVQDRVGRGGVDLFQNYDLNRDGYLSIFEFEPLIPHLKKLSSSFEEVIPMEKYFEYSPKEDEEVFVLQANFTPLQLETMTKEDILTHDITGKDTLYGLKNWKESIRKRTVFGVTEFQSLLPEDMESITVGKPYHVLPYKMMAVDQGPGGVYSSSRYYPPVPKDKEGVLFRLLGMMHRRPFVSMRFPPRGTVACVRAFSDQYIHVVFRMHAEFQLNEPPLNPFWFTPAQFVGDLVMARDGSHVRYFHMRVPSERRLNVDMEWLTRMVEGEDSMEVDIGYMPQMEWTMEEPSFHVPATSKEEILSLEPRSATSLQTPDQMKWSSEAPREEVLRFIEIEFFPFKTVTYHNLTRGMELSREQNKPLHAIFLWGALDDQSC